MPARGRQLTGRKRRRALRRAPVQKQLNRIKQQIRKEPFINVNPVQNGTLDETAVITHQDLHGGLNSGNLLDGITVFLKSVRIKGWFKSVGATNVVGRLDLVLDRQPTPGTPATYDQIYYPVVGAATSVNGMMNPLHKTRFKLLASVRGAPLTNDGQVFMFDRYVKMNHKVATQGDGSWTQAQQTKNAVLVVHWADANANQPTYQYVVQIVGVDDT